MGGSRGRRLRAMQVASGGGTRCSGALACASILDGCGRGHSRALVSLGRPCVATYAVSSGVSITDGITIPIRALQGAILVSHPMRASSSRGDKLCL